MTGLHMHSGSESHDKHQELERWSRGVVLTVLGWLCMHRNRAAVVRVPPPGNQGGASRGVRSKPPTRQSNPISKSNLPQPRREDIEREAKRKRRLRGGPRASANGKNNAKR